MSSNTIRALADALVRSLIRQGAHVRVAVARARWFQRVAQKRGLSSLRATLLAVQVANLPVETRTSIADLDIDRLDRHFGQLTVEPYADPQLTLGLDPDARRAPLPIMSWDWCFRCRQRVWKIDGEPCPQCPKRIDPDSPLRAWLSLTGSRCQKCSYLIVDDDDDFCQECGSAWRTASG